MSIIYVSMCNVKVSLFVRLCLCWVLFALYTQVRTYRFLALGTKTELPFIKYVLVVCVAGSISAETTYKLTHNAIWQLKHQFIWLNCCQFHKHIKKWHRVVWELYLFQFRSCCWLNVYLCVLLINLITKC